MGLVLMAFRRASDRTLLVWAGVLIASHFVMTTVRLLSGFDPGAPVAWLGAWFATSVLGLTFDGYYRTYAEGGWFDVLKGNLAGPAFRFAYLLSSSRFQRVLGMFLVGLWVGRQGILADPVAHKTLLRRVVIWCLPIGLVLNTIVAWVQLEQPPVKAIAIGETAAYVLGVVPLAMSYVAALSLLWLQPAWQPRLAWLAPAGRMALTCYLMQSIIGCGLFYGIGLGWAGKVGPTYFPLIAVMVFAAQVAWCRWWLQRYRFGPVEWLWRSMTYGTWQSMARQQPVPIAVGAR
jgi:uncharacterized protein